MAKHYRSLVRQTLHYVARPHSGISTGPIVGPSAWKSADFPNPESYVEVLPQELWQGAVDVVTRLLNLGIEPREWQPGLVAFPGWGPRLAGWRVRLAQGRGFVVLRGAPVERLSQAQAEGLFWALGLNLGVPGAQNPEGDLLGHVKDQQLGKKVRLYRTNRNIKFHCDAADVVGLLCLRASAEGGESRIASSVAIANEVHRRDRGLFRRLFSPFYLDTHGQGGIRYMPVTPLRYCDGVLRSNYHSDYFRSSRTYEDCAGLDDAAAQALDLYDEIADEIALEMALAPGDIQLISNHTIVHGRRGYKDAEGSAGRHLLRLWLSLPTHEGVQSRALRAAAYAELLGRLGKERLRQRPYLTEEQPGVARNPASGSSSEAAQ